MDEEGLSWGILIGVGLILGLLVLSLPVEGNIFGFIVRLPIIGWIALAGFVILAFFLYFGRKG